MRGCEVTVHFFLQREAIILSVAGAIISLNSQSFLVRQLYYRLASLTGCRRPHGFQQGQRLGQPVTLLLFFFFVYFANCYKTVRRSVRAKEQDSQHNWKNGILAQDFSTLY